MVRKADDDRPGLLDGLGRYAGVACVFFVLGVLAFLLEIQSPSWVQFYGIKVHGVTINGLTYYRYEGQRYAIDNTKASVNSPPKATTVWLSRSDPTNQSKAYIDNTANRWLDAVFVSMWFIGSAVMLGAGFGIRAHRRRRRRDTAGRFGGGFSDDAVQRYLARQRDVVRRHWSVDE